MASRICVIFFLLLTTCTHVPAAVKNSERKPAQSDEAVLPKLKDAIAIIKSGRANTVPDFLAELKKRFPVYMDTYTLMYDSFSAQESSFQDPRVILIGMGEFVMTFNGSAAQRGFNQMETMEYTKANGFRFRQIEFIKEGGPREESLTAAEIDPSLSSNLVRVSKPNISRCTSCHGEAVTRPIWEDYFMWPGAYGSEDDRVYNIGLSKKVRASLGRVFNLKDESRDPEAQELARFHAARAEHPRYRWLGDIEKLISGGNYGFSAEPHPNFFLSRVFVKYSFEQLAKKISASTQAYPQIHRILYSLQCDYDTSSAEDEKLRDRQEAATIAMAHEQVLRTKKSYGEALDQNFVTFEEAKIKVSGFDISNLETDGGLRRLAAVFHHVRRLYPKDPLFDQLATAALIQTAMVNVVPLSKALKEAGIELSDYAVNLRRHPNFSTGYSPVRELVSGIVAGLKVKRPGFDWDSLDEAKSSAACDNLRARLLK